ncbi:MAG: hypothetical protein KAJ07_01645 [Planctomycetes bacterium]|nr:hypothetical protein [Planctomycetota bacterium]
MIKNITLLLSLVMLAGVVPAGPYTEPGISGYVGDDGQLAGVDPNNSRVNPIFRDWARKVHRYSPSPGVALMWQDTSLTLGPATGDKLHVASLGDVDTDITPLTPPGEIIIEFSDHDNIISDKAGYDFAVFENGFVVIDTDPSMGSVAGEMFGELAYVEVATDPNFFARFPSVSLTPGRTGVQGSVEVSNVYNLAGKHSNEVNNCTGTPFDLSDLSDHPLVLSGDVDLNNIKYIRLVDVPGGGYYFDEANSAGYPDPDTAPEYNVYGSDHPIYDAWLTGGSGGFDLEALGVLNEQEFIADINLDGLVDMFDFVLFASVWQVNFGEANWIERCNLAEQNDTVIDVMDLNVFVSQWLSQEKWRH